MISELQQPLDSGFGAKSEPIEVLEGIDLNGKTALVTGGYSGIGLETTRALSDCGARVIVPARRRDVAIKELNGIIGEEDILNLDLADPKSVNKFVEEFLDNGTSLDILINNAAVMACTQMPPENGWDLQQSIEFCQELKEIGVDLIDCSSGGSSTLQKLNPEPNYQVPFSSKIREEVGIKTGAVGLITDSHQAEEILRSNHADVIFLGREFLRNPYWPLKAKKDLDGETDAPDQYARAI